MLHSQREHKPNQNSSLRIHVSKFGSVHYPTNWEHPLRDEGTGVQHSSGKGQKATIALLYCFHTFSSKLLNYHQSKATQDETDKISNQSAPAAFLVLAGCNLPLQGSDKQNHSSTATTGEGKAELIPGSVTIISPWSVC